MNAMKHILVSFIFVGLLCTTLIHSISAQTITEESSKDVRLSIPPVSPFPSNLPTRNPTTRFPSVNPTGLMATIRASACSSKLSSLTQRAETLTEAMERTISKLNTRVDTVNNYYLTTVVPTGQSVPDYDNMVNDMNSKKAAIASLIAITKHGVDNMNCKNEDLPTQARTFSSNMQTLIDAVRQYTASVRVFVTAIRLVSVNTSQAIPKPVMSITSMPKP